jgi:hypothetical protein
MPAKRQYRTGRLVNVVMSGAVSGLKSLIGLSKFDKNSWIIGVLK